MVDRNTMADSKMSLSQMRNNKKKKREMFSQSKMRTSSASSLVSMDSSFGEGRASSNIFKIILDNDQMLPDIYDKNVVERKY